MRARIGTARILLASCNGESHVHASRTQAAALVATISQLQPQLSLDEKAALSILVGEVRWAGTDMDPIMAALSPAEVAKSKTRHSMQNYMSVHEYFTADEWRVMQDSKATISHTRDVICSRCAKLGLRTPSEQTVKWLTCLLLVLCETPESLNSMHSSLKHDMMKSFKGHFKSYIRRATHPADYIAELPAAPVLLKRMHPNLYDSAYCAPEVPISCLVDSKLIASVDVSFRCREGSSVPQQSQMRRQPDSSSGENMMHTFMQTVLQSFLMNQHGDRRVASESSIDFRCLNVGRPPLALKNLQISPARVPLSLGNEPHFAASVPEAAQPASQPAAAPPSCPQELPAQPAAAPPSQEAMPNSSAMALLDALTARDAEKKEEKVASKRAAQQAPVSQPNPKVAKKAAAVTAKPAAKVSPAKPPAKVTSAKPAAKVKAKQLARFSVERTRMQVMCRTGLGGAGSSTAFRYGQGEKFSNEAAAVSAAEKWLAKYGG